MKSSYKENRLDLVFKTLCASIAPKKIVEFGILEGYSLDVLVENRPDKCTIEAFDLFDDFPYNAAVYEDVNERFGQYDGVLIEKADFYKSVDYFEDKSVDIMHIDIANDGLVYRWAIDNYMPKISEGGVIVLEGGSKERDDYDWMIKYNKEKINPYLESIKDEYNVTIIEDFPSLTIIKKIK